MKGRGRRPWLSSAGKLIDFRAESQYTIGGSVSTFGLSSPVAVPLFDEGSQPLILQVPAIWYNYSWTAHADLRMLMQGSSGGIYEAQS